MANLFEAICSILMIRNNQSAFVQLEGIELFLRMIKARKVAYPFALRGIKYALENNPEVCERFVAAGGLKTVFPLFMSRGVQKKEPSNGKTRKKKKVDVKEIEQNSCYIISTLIKMLPIDSISHKRIIKKFKDENMEKTDRLVELHESFVSTLDTNINGEAKASSK